MNIPKEIEHMFSKVPSENERERIVREYIECENRRIRQGYEKRVCIEKITRMIQDTMYSNNNSYLEERIRECIQDTLYHNPRDLRIVENYCRQKILSTRY